MPSQGEWKGMKLGLEAIAAMDASFGYPSRTFKSVHVAGTNGKGSVSTKIAKGLELNGLKVGLFTSPHISTIRERIQINGEMIAIEDLRRLSSPNLTYFENITLTAFRYFAEQGVDFAVIEVGLGGRLDATNILMPELSVITSIDFDHMEQLGSTLEAIAREKAGIIKPGVPALMGPFVRPRHCFPTEHWVETTGGDYEEENRAIAKRALEILDFEPKGLDAVPPCRFQQIGKVIFDGAHNVGALRRTLERIPKPYGCVAAFSREPRALLALLHEADPLIVTEIDHERILPGVEKDFSAAFERAYHSCDRLLVTGSFYIMERALEELKKVTGSDKL